eukprot:CAMPEP_0201687084 /NCGR_PEP_ID=MMETSP0578-20130828/1286_1 /ASSEMBLY_ACC=CAM_ASM_000663 /TAXON_ID=267565 /ORGANISM="Skeletonema grethea, Strain CCMP 1804" /LENGTH=582 /DNA_ID=CAMNT_0048171209 /DNA_START=125 /DNA_END=1876 /DNA_ORIENTATION=+
MFYPLFRTKEAMPPIDPDEEFDLIVVGSGNGACGFLGECLKHVPADYRVLVLEEGDNFFFTSDITHQAGWSKSYANGSAFTLHNAVTPTGRSVLAGRARTLGGGGSINYTMIHESSEWLVKQAGRDVAYWDKCKEELNASLKRPDPLAEGYQTPFADFIAENAQKAGYAAPNKDDMIQNIPSVNESENKKRLYYFPTQFDMFGSRTNSGVSLVKWEQIKYRWNTTVTGLVMGTMNESNYCNGVQTRSKESGANVTYKVKKDTGRVVLCGGSQSPRLLLNTEELAGNEKIGQRVNDHICMPLALYVVKKDKASVVGATDNYESLFAEVVVESKTDEGDATTTNVTIDFFSGDVLRLIYLISSLYLCYVPFNGFKRLMGRFPIIFTYLSNTLRMILTAIISLIQVLGRLIPFLPREIKITTALVKFNASKEGYYERSGSRIVLRFFDDERDSAIAEEAINQNLAFLESYGTKPPFIIRKLFQLVTKIPYRQGRQVRRYVRNFARKTLLSEQHLAGGCVFGDVVDKGLEDSNKTGQVFGTSNLYVADLSILPLPRVSTQMTAYLMGHHVAKQLYSAKKSSWKKNN